MSGRKQRREAQLALADFQRGAVDALREAIGATARAIANRPEARRSIALAQGVSLLQAPTGSGKTLMLGRVLEGLAGGLPEKTVWFWFAPYSGLVRQTGDALNAHCRRLRQRDVYTDRDPAQARDGDIFIQTWAAVAARNKDARKTRRDREDMLSLDTMLEELRDRGFFVGVVVDEAHLNFGTSAKAAAAFYLETLRPDFTLLATATPHDDKLAAFEAAAGIGETNRVIVDRDSVVAAGLNKAGIVLGYLRVPEKKQALVDIEQATLQAAWDHHRRIAARLEERNVGLTPLMLVQVEDQAAGGDDPVDRAREMLLEFGVPKQAIAVHTSGEPDPYFHTLAFDPEKQVLIFKVAVATGFDAPRAWTLVSLRPNRGKEFGLQIVGRIMRVHPLLRPLHGDDALLDRGYVFLSDPEMQGGLQQAADELRAVRQGIELVTDRVDVFEVSPDSRDAAGLAEADAQAVFSAAPSEAAALRARVAAFVQQERLPAATLDYAPEEQARMLNAAETSRAFERSIASTLDMFTGAPDAAAPAIGPARRGTKRKTDGLVAYALQESLGLPHALRREMLPAPEEIEGLVAEMARAVPIDAEIKTYLLEKRVPAELHKLEVFRRELERETVKVEISNARVAERAQRAFQFNESIDPRDLKRALVQRLRTICEEEGIDYAERDLRRTIDLIGLRRPGHL